MFAFIRTALVLLYFVLVAILGIFVCVFRPFNPDNSRICGRLFSWGAIKLLGITLLIEGEEQLDGLEPGIVVANHQSNFDLFVHGAVIPAYTATIGKKSLKYLPFFGQVYWLAGNILIDRSNSKKSIDMMSQITDAIKNHGTSIWVFVEGTRNLGKGLLPFKKGAFHMAVQTQSPIYPICASTYAGRLQLGKWHSGVVLIKVLAPISTAGVGDENVPTLVDETQNMMADEIHQLDRRVAAMTA